MFYFESLAAALGMCTGQGSNSWSVHGSRTASGNTILCNDPHLQLAIPNTMYENHCLVEDADGEVILHMNGVALPGVPLCVIFHNEDIAIGITLGMYNMRCTSRTLYECHFVCENRGAGGK